MTEDAIKQKFLACATRAVDEASASELYSFLRNLRRQRELGSLWPLLTTEH